ncbi:PP2C-like domain-containing protein CG9801 [Stomoxys calcitrans]|uniref:PPM-type phosphatase domain-containing protein n=1 Tax=Stomoxys calcitrans TaxID=35570 RepID=A0A1I8PN62_STOCA|nr:PP2C-like domain-containing protein CG9801 [Stomoxys calcitrans]XP_013097226.1 PP2C-like domain-containing protein CG9801 [Stomoxys calcitrans]XP_013097227.1 PP2C-like domain-containing protein CG9801 [Stomoxys calcitrans]
MPSLRQKVTTYFRQLSFIAEPRDGPKSPRKTDDDGNFIIKYLEGRMDRHYTPGPEIYNGQNPTDLPQLKIASYPTGASTITAACTGPDDGLTGIKRSKLHLSASYADDIDFIDTIQETDCYEVRKSINTSTTSRGHSNKIQRLGSNRRLSNSGGPTSSSNDQNANKGNSAGGGGGMRSRKNSKSSISNLSQSTKDSSSASKSTSQRNEENSNKSTTIVVSMVSSAGKPPPPSATTTDLKTNAANDQNNKNLLNTNKTEDTSLQLKSQENGESLKSEANGTKILEDTTERLLREAVSNQSTPPVVDPDDVIAGVSNWKMESDLAYGISVSLYENNMLTKEPMGNPIADCYGMVVRGNAAVMALADGVNWGDGARLAARSAVHGCLDYLDRAIFGFSQECTATSTQEVFVSLLRSLWEGHGCILEVGGALSTLTIAVVLPLAKDENVAINGEVAGNEKYVVCACNVGDSLGYVYSKKHGVREFTLASHDITSMRDMRDALGALGPADGNKPELSNLTLSMTIIDHGDIVFLTSDGISDNFDPVVGKFAEAWTPDVKLMPTTPATHTGVLAPKRQNKSASAIYARLHGSSNPTSPQPPVRPPRTKKSSSPECASGSASAPSRPKYMRSHTVIEPRRLSSAGLNPTARQRDYDYKPKIPKSSTGLPLVTGPQRHALTLYRLEDLLSYGINGTFSPCSSARRLCHLLIDFVRMITSARRKTLEQRELFYKLSTGPDGIKREVEMNRMQHRAARKRVIDSSAFSALPGKLDHATVVAYTVGSGVCTASNGHISLTSDRQRPNNESNAANAGAGHSLGSAPLQSKEFQETNF